MLTGSLLVLPSAADGQDSTAAVLQRARRLYEQLEVERALPLLRLVVSPQWQFDITGAQRAEAYKYLGAALVIAGRSDSAALQFQAALARDPFTDLDPLEFTPAQITAFTAARARVFVVATRPVAATRVDARTDRVVFTVVTTHAADLTARLRPVGGGEPLTVFAGGSDGVREIFWDGLSADRQVATPGRYELVVTGRSRLLAGTDSARAFFDLAHDVAAGEDTLPSLDPTALLPEYEAGSRSAMELGKGVGVAVGVLVVGQVLTHDALGAGQGAAAAVVAVTGVTAGVVALLARARRGEIPDNVAANQRREAERRGTNDAIRRRNAARVAATILVVTPAAGVTR